MDMLNIREQMAKWNELTYHQGIMYIFLSNPIRQKCLYALEKQGILERTMNGSTVEKLPFKYENSLQELIYSDIFQRCLKKGFLSPASYIAEIVKEFDRLQLRKAGVNQEFLFLGVIGRGLRAFPSFLREMDLEQKLNMVSPAIKAFRTTPKDDIEMHADLYISYKADFYRIWSYQNTSWGLSNMIDKFNGNRGELPKGNHILCPYNYRSAFYVESVYNWCLHNDAYINKVKEVITTWKPIDYEIFRKNPKFSEEVRNFQFIVKH